MLLLTGDKYNGEILQAKCLLKMEVRNFVLENEEILLEILKKLMKMSDITAN